MKKVKFYVGIFLLTGWSFLLLGGFTVCDILGNNYRDVYNPFWINISMLMIMGAVVWAMLAIALEETIDENFFTK